MYKLCSQVAGSKPSQQLNQSEEQAVALQLFAQWSVQQGAFESVAAAHEALATIAERGNNPSVKDLCSAWQAEVSQRLDEINARGEGE